MGDNNRDEKMLSPEAKRVVNNAYMLCAVAELAGLTPAEFAEAAFLAARTVAELLAKQATPVPNVNWAKGHNPFASNN
jgi:hypothetical protein